MKWVKFKKAKYENTSVVNISRYDRFYKSEGSRSYEQSPYPILIFTTADDALTVEFNSFEDRDEAYNNIVGLYADRI